MKGLSSFQLEYNYTGAWLNMWDPSALELSGIWTPPELIPSICIGLKVREEVEVILVVLQGRGCSNYRVQQEIQNGRKQERELKHPPSRKIL